MLKDLKIWAIVAAIFAAMWQYIGFQSRKIDDQAEEIEDAESINRISEATIAGKQESEQIEDEEIKDINTDNWRDRITK